MVCLETSFLVDVLRGQGSAEDVMAEIDEQPSRPTVTPVAAAEVWVGAELGSAVELGATRDLLGSLAWLEFTRESARRAGRIQSELMREGAPIGITDCAIAAIAIEHGERLVTRDADFERIPGLDLRTY